ncbi:MAG: protein phosphatase 2C domain-containing protein, partial [Gammaproteobacteria bacterium]|nr:protein phosphatase 2C domain-containing protein [Gammaproteobacteria bacterium]
MALQINAAGITDVGCQRTNNEDALLIRQDLGVFAVADGVGGAAAGEVASHLFTQSCEQEFEQYSGWNQDYGPLISRCFINANQNIIDHSKQNPDTKGMGCTAEVLTFFENEYFIGHVGDSRTYLVREKQLEQLTKDHSFIQEQIDLGLVSHEEAKTHWLRNAIYRAVGHIDEIEVDVLRGKVRNGDLFLLCSDGLTDMVTDDDIERICNTGLPIQARVQQLIDLA